MTYNIRWRWVAYLSGGNYRQRNGGYGWWPGVVLRTWNYFRQGWWRDRTWNEFCGPGRII